MKKIRGLKHLLGALLIISSLLFIGFLFFEWQNTEKEEKIKEINEWIEKGQEASTIKERRDFYGKALKALWPLQQKTPFYERNGQMEEIIGNLFFQLEEYPLAIAFYERAKSQKETTEKLDYNLQKAQEKLGLLSVKKSGSYFVTPSFYRIAFFSFSLFLLFFFFSLFFSKKKLSYLAYFFLVVAFLSWGTLLFSHLFGKEEAILIKASYLRGEPSALFKPSSEVIPKGLKVEVLKKEGGFVLISTEVAGKQERGFVLKEALFFIN